MNQSVALRDILICFYETESSGTVSALESLVSYRDDALAIGSDPEEWWLGYETIYRVFRAQAGVMGRVQIKSQPLSIGQRRTP